MVISEILSHQRNEILVAVTIKVMVLLDVTPYNLVYTTMQHHLSKDSVHQLQEHSICLTDKEMTSASPVHKT
jgi:hypothetical protein